MPRRDEQGGAGRLDGAAPWILRVNQAAQVLGLSERTLRMLISSGRIPVVRLSPRRIGIAVEDLQRFIEKNRR